MSGVYIKDTRGNLRGSTYPESSDAVEGMMNDFYGGLTSIAKSAGAARYGDNGYFNAVFGKQITAAMYSSDNVFTAIGTKPYNHEGVRIALEQASYGLDSNGDFVGLGAGTVQDGAVPDSVALPVEEFREPFKDLPFSYNIGLSLQELEAKEDDTIAYKDYVDKITRNYSDLMDKSLVKPVGGKIDITDGRETGINSLPRLISSYKEIGKVENGVTIDAGMVSPFGGTSAARGDFYAFRSAGESNMDSQLIDVAGGTLTTAVMNQLWRDCAVNWAESASPNNKVWFTSNMVQAKLAALKEATGQTYFDSVYIQRDFHGVKTVPGRDIGFVVKSFNNIPMIMSGNLNFNFNTKKVSSAKFGDIMLVDLDHIWFSMLTPIQVYSVNNPAITRMLQEANVITMRGETRIDSFIQHGKIIGIADES